MSSEKESVGEPSDRSAVTLANVERSDMDRANELCLQETTSASIENCERHEGNVSGDVTERGATSAIIAPKASGKKRIRFNNDWDVLLLKSIVISGAHIAEHGQSQKKFEDALKVFLDTAPPSKL